MVKRVTLALIAGLCILFATPPLIQPALALIGASDGGSALGKSLNFSQKERCYRESYAGFSSPSFF